MEGMGEKEMIKNKNFKTNDSYEMTKLMNTRVNYWEDKYNNKKFLTTYLDKNVPYSLFGKSCSLFL